VSPRVSTYVPFFLYSYIYGGHLGFYNFSPNVPVLACEHDISHSCYWILLKFLHFILVWVRIRPHSKMKKKSVIYDFDKLFFNEKITMKSFYIIMPNVTKPLVW